MLDPGVDNFANDLHSSLTVTAKTAGGAAVKESFGNVTLENAIGSADLSGASITGNIDAQQGVQTLVVGNLSTQSSATTLGSIHIGAAPQSLLPAVQFGVVSNYNFTSDTPLKSFSAQSWTEAAPSTEGATPLGISLISAPGVGSFSISSNLNADVQIADTSLPARTPTTTSFTVGGAVNDSIILFSGSIGKVSLGSLNNSDFLVGVGAATTKSPVIPAKFTDFTEPALSIGSFTVGTKVPPGTNLFSNSTVAAPSFGKVAVYGVDHGAGNANGFVADQITSYSRDSVRIPLSPGSNDPTGNYHVEILTS